MVDVYFGTNRNPRPADDATYFGKNFSSMGLSDLRFGKAKVTNLQIEVATHREILLPLDGLQQTDHRKSMLGSQAWFDGLHQLMCRSGRDTLVFIHGYNTSFKEALQAAATLADKLQSAGGGLVVNMVCFSWPSDGTMRPWLDYANDRRDAAASGAALARALLKTAHFLRNLPGKQACRQNIHLIAHSMGNYVLRHALQEIRGQSQGDMPRLFDQICLIAADEDDDAFEHNHKLKLLPQLGRRVNLYINRNDRAMTISDMTKGNPDRLGDDGPRMPFQVPGKVTQIDCTPVARGALEHNYFVDAARVTADIIYTLDGTDPALIPGRTFLADRNRFILND